METDLNARLQAYLRAAEAERSGYAQAAEGSSRYASALRCSEAASAAASASLICGYVRALRADDVPAFVPPGRNELDFLLGQKISTKAEALADAADGRDPAEHNDEDGGAGTRLPLPAGRDSIAAVASGAVGVASIKQLTRKDGDA